MRKLKFVGLFIAAGLLMQSAYAACSNPARQTGTQICLGPKSSPGMSIYTCQSNGTWVKTGGSCGPCVAVQVDSSTGSTWCAW